MSPSRWEAYCFHLGFPRVSGDEPPASMVASGLWEFSPRERG